MCVTLLRGRCKGNGGDAGGNRAVVVVNSFLFVLGTNGRMQPVVMAPPGVIELVVVVISFLFVLGTKVRMQPVVMAPKNLSTKHQRLKEIEPKKSKNTRREHQRKIRRKTRGKHEQYNLMQYI